MEKLSVKNGLHVQVRLTAACICHRSGVHRSQIAGCVIDIVAAAEHPACRVRITATRRRGDRKIMRMRRYLGVGQRMGLFAAPFAERVAGTHMNGRPRPEIGQREVHTAVAPEGCTQQRKQRLILIDRQELAIA